MDNATVSGRDGVDGRRFIGLAAADKTTPIVRDCRTGRMSAEAATAHTDASDTDVVHLAGGIDAWVAAGRQSQ